MKERETNKFFTITGNFQIPLTLSLIESNGLKSPEIRISILWIWSNYKSFLQITFTAITEISIPLRGSFHPLKDYRISKGLS